MRRLKLSRVVDQLGAFRWLEGCCLLDEAGDGAVRYDEGFRNAIRNTVEEADETAGVSDGLVVPASALETYGG